MYTDVINTTERAVYIREEQLGEIKSQVSDKEDRYISDINSCIEKLHSCLEKKEIKLDRLEVIDTKYHEEDDD